jgi:hypothetical protein
MAVELNNRIYIKGGVFAISTLCVQPSVNMEAFKSFVNNAVESFNASTNATTTSGRSQNAPQASTHLTSLANLGNDSQADEAFKYWGKLVDDFNDEENLPPMFMSLVICMHLIPL